MESILILGANGQLGTELQLNLISDPGVGRVVASDIYEPQERLAHFEIADILDQSRIAALIEKYEISTIINMAAILSASGERKTLMAWRINVDGLLNVLEVARRYGVKVFQPSSIAVFGPDVSKEKVAQDAPKNPITMYGVTKVAGESLCQYYARRYGVDVRSVRFPGVIGAHAMPGGGTTDYAVDIFHKALSDGAYSCFLRSSSYLPMIYVDDAIRAIKSILAVPSDRIKVRTSYNINALSFSPSELAQSIKQKMPDFEMRYAIDERQGIADSWPASLEDGPARSDWSWQETISTTDALVERMWMELHNTEMFNNS